jgi:hypothetical protein
MTTASSESLFSRVRNEKRLAKMRRAITWKKISRSVLLTSRSRGAQYAESDSNEPTSTDEAMQPAVDGDNRFSSGSAGCTDLDWAVWSGWSGLVGCQVSSVHDVHRIRTAHPMSEVPRCRLSPRNRMYL